MMLLKELLGTIVMMANLLPVGNSGQGSEVMNNIQAWLKGIGFTLAAIALIILMITGGVYVANVISPQLLGWGSALATAA